MQTRNNAATKGRIHKFFQCWEIAMRKSIPSFRTCALITVACWLIGASETQAWSTALYNRGTPVYTYYLGDDLAYEFEFAMNHDTTGWTVDYGVGKSTDGTSWTWRSATYSRWDGNSVWKSKANEQRFSSIGSWYYSGRFTLSAYIEYASADWATDRTTLNAESYFTVNELNNPSSQNATPGADPNSQIDLAWSKDTQGHNVMIVRKTSDQVWTEPTQGDSYSDKIGVGVVVYNGSGETTAENGLTQNTTYDYKFYSNNNSYYSLGVTKSLKTAPEPGLMALAGLLLVGIRTSLRLKR